MAGVALCVCSVIVLLSLGRSALQLQSTANFGGEELTETPNPARRGGLGAPRPLVIARSDSDEAIQILARAALDCFACARNDVSLSVSTSSPPGLTRWSMLTRSEAEFRIEYTACPHGLPGQARQ